ncbi:MAG: TolC family protein [Verrucomicrobiota bacterium]|nr:TolC family protein [Verrucomicrobiota bacterium]
MIKTTGRASNLLLNMMTNYSFKLFGILLLVAVLLAGCEAAKFRDAADDEVYGILKQRGSDVLGAEQDYDIRTAWSARAPDAIPPAEIITDRFNDNARVLTLEAALGMAVTNNRAYQLQKETLYLSALSLTGTRHRFVWQPTTSTADLGLVRESDKGLKGDSNLDLTFSKLFKTGGTLTATLANDLVLYFNGKPKVPDITLKLTQPLLRGAGRAIAEEVLTQAERDVVYAVRDFSHYQKTFAIETVSEYFRILQKKDSVRNSYSNYQNLQGARARAEAMVDAQRLPKFQVDQARQKELSSRVKYLTAVESYRAALDAFKQRLGLPLGEDLKLDDTALRALVQRGLTPLNLNARNGYLIAVTNRLDMLNQIDKYEDSQRKVRVAADNLQPSLNLVVDASLTKQFYSSFSPEDFAANAGLQLGLPLDKLTERNAYRTSLISFEKQLRALATELDGLREDIRQGVRQLAQERENYFIQQNALALAQQRVTVMPLLLDANQADIRDQLEAQADLVSAQNAVTSAMVNYHVARWKLLKNLGIMRVEAGQFWLKNQPIPGVPAPVNPSIGAQLPNVVTPGQVFGEQK